MEIKIPLISYGRVELLEEGYETLEFFDCYVRLRGRAKYNEPKDYDDENSLKEERTRNYEFVGIKSYITGYGKRYVSEDKVWMVFIDIQNELPYVFRFLNHADAKNLYDKIHRWYFEGIVE